ncbi:MAG: DUF2293 domain-containing protein [Syntrophobacteraceae bacterium]
MALEYIKVYVSFSDSPCAECGEPLHSGDFIVLGEDRKPVCLTCADLDHLVYLRAGNTALTRRAAKYSTLRAVVEKWSKARKRNEPQGRLVEAGALEKAEQECMADGDARAKQRERAAKRREELDGEFVQRFAEHIRLQYPHCPTETATEIAEHACLKHSGRVGRSAAAKSFDKNAVTLAVRAHIRHTETEYDQLLALNYDRHEARDMVGDAIDEVLSKWKSNE